MAQTGSVAIDADAMHYVGDIATNGGVIVAIMLSAGLKWDKADPIMALIVALALVWSAWSVFRQSYDQLMDRELADERPREDQSHRHAPMPTCAACTICARARRASTPSSRSTSSSIRR